LRLLLDTHAFIWFATGDAQLGAAAALAIAEADNEVLLSSASVWEMAIKASLGKLVLTAPLASIVAAAEERGIQSLPVSAAHALRVESLAFHHRDPFDRLLIGQALEEHLIIATCDEAFRNYGVPLLWS